MRDSTYLAHVYDGPWQGLKYPWHLLDVMDLMLALWTRGVESPGPSITSSGRTASSWRRTCAFSPAATSRHRR